MMFFGYIVLASFMNNTVEWTQFKNTYAKNYGNKMEDLKRMKIYFENKRMIDNHNAKYARGEVSFTMKMNHFGDLTEQEYRARLNHFNSSAVVMGRWQYAKPELDNIADTVDWRGAGAVVPVKDQGQCGSCWAFSVTGAVEAAHYLKTGNLVSLSEQNLVDCAGAYHTQGCNGGDPVGAYQYIMNNKGIDTEQSYPYRGVAGPCQFNPNNIGATISGAYILPEGSESYLQSTVGSTGPVSIAMDASHQSFQFYAGGVYDEPSCNSWTLSHAMLVIGYGTEGGQDYWLVKNSWGTSWGEEGYIKMSRNRNNQCGIASYATFPTV